ncbi:PspC domain-containing protein [candidate division WWE3 bacterium]|uniref:PspC domain-containing protein n=1 Tax=candidate division WWE3 bacterium TaxID=2053526 RepID=A0A955LHM1_UNCKA|nr:PspC domain-containing protein [candidate division WWE3 bacterium]
MNQKTLRRSATNQVIAGVCGGIAEYFQVDPTIVRVIFVILGLTPGPGILLYIILWLIIPGPTSNSKPGEDTIREGFKEMEEKIESFGDSIEEKFDHEDDTEPVQSDSTQNHYEKRQQSGPSWLGIALLIIGGWFLLENLGFLRIFDLGRLWPLLLIFFGIYFISKRD